MGWSRIEDISVIFEAEFPALRDGLVDAIVGGDADIEAAEREGYPVLADTRPWNDALAGNSVLVRPEWLQDTQNQEAARRFLRATVEALAIYHLQPEVAKQVMMDWYGMDRDLVDARFARTDYVPRKPFPCVEGIRNTMGLYDSFEMRRFQPSDFYDDSLMRELDESGFIDALYR
jgi:ABC-type nitrate/sulfonate/bicarbonate transport system substrate-binding protein